MFGQHLAGERGLLVVDGWEPGGVVYCAADRSAGDLNGSLGGRLIKSRSRHATVPDLAGNPGGIFVWRYQRPEGSAILLVDQ
jgi:hypothetical protein